MKKNRDLLLIGTCRIKRMLAYVEDRKFKKDILQISTHVHYAAEIQQMVSYLQGKELPEDLLGVIIDDINVGKLNSYKEIEEWRKKTAQYLEGSQKVIIEISSLKNFLLNDVPEYYGNLTALNSIIGEKTRLADFIPTESLRKKFSTLSPRRSDEEEVLNRMKAIKALLSGKNILWMSHFRYFIEEKGKEIEERKNLAKWVKKGAELLGDDYFDQTLIVDMLGTERALKDSSHYTEEAERKMTDIISLWIHEGKITIEKKVDGYLSRLNGVSMKSDNKNHIVENIKQYTKERQYLKVIEEYKKLLELDPANIKYMYSLIGQALLANDNETAFVFLKKMEAIDAGNELFLLSKGKFNYQQKQYGRAREAFYDLLTSTRYAEQAYERIVNSYIIEKNIEALSDFLSKGLPEGVQKYKYDFLLGKYYFVQRKFDRARSYFQKSLEKNLSYEHSYVWLVKCALKLENHQLGKEDIEKAYQHIINTTLLLQTKSLEKDMDQLNNRTLLIGTCRIKRMLAYIEDRKLKKDFVQISTHVHYVAEIQQMLSYLQGKELPKELLGVIIDDINVGKLNSYKEIEEWRKKTAQYIKNSKKVIIEISSLKSFLVHRDPEYFGNITALNSIIGGKGRLADFVPKEGLRKKFSNLVSVRSDKEEVILYMKKIKKLLPDKKILWMSHFRYFIEDKGKEIEERKKLFQWVSEGAKLLGDDYFDQTVIVDTLGVEKALKDSSHYTENAERFMSKVISLWIEEEKILLKN